MKTLVAIFSLGAMTLPLMAQEHPIEPRDRHESGFDRHFRDRELRFDRHDRFDTEYHGPREQHCRIVVQRRGLLWAQHNVRTRICKD